MKQINITIHPFSALIGAAIVCLTMLTVGAVTVQGSSSTRDVSAIEVVSDPHPRDYVRVNLTTPFTVPAGKLFHLTSLGGTEHANDLAYFFIDNIQVMAAHIYTPHGNACSVRPIPPGIVAASQSVLTVSGSNAVAYGYLVDA